MDWKDDVIHGKWTWREIGRPFDDDYEYGWICSECEEYPEDKNFDYIYDDLEKPPSFKYCPWCGSMMKL